MTKEDLHVNQENQITIRRSPHNKENPYVMISKSMLRDQSISPKSKGILCYLLGLPDDWKVHVRQVAKALGIGKDQVYSALKELIKNGYAQRVTYKSEKGRFAESFYELFEEKQPIDLSGNPDVDVQDTEKQTLLKKEPKEKRGKKDITSLKVPVPSKSADASDEKSSFSSHEITVENVSQEIIYSMQRSKSDYVPPPSTASLKKHVDLMIRRDKRDPQKILDVLNWALADHFWHAKMFKPNPAEYLRKQYDQLDAQMNSPTQKKERKFAPCSDSKKALESLRNGKGEVL